MDHYTIIGGDNKEYGPVTLEDVNNWMREGRADATTRIRKNEGAWAAIADFAEFVPLTGASAATAPESLSTSRMERAAGASGAAAAPAADKDVVQRILEPLARATGWMKFLAVVMFIYAGFNILSIWGIVICWIPIWMGLLLLRSANLVNASMVDGSPTTAIAATRQLKTFFVLLGVMMLVTFLATGFLLLAMIAFGMGMS